MLLNVTRTIKIPDPYKLARFQHSPDLGPRLLFFSGGSALKETSLTLTKYTHNSIHIITPFDSGGSSAKLRDAFHMPAIGDIRNRLLALADRSLHGNPEIHKLFVHRFPKDGEQAELREELAEMVKGRHPLVAAIPDPMRKIIRHHLDLFSHHAQKNGFDLRKASIGNLILAAGYLENRRNFDMIIFIFSKLVQVRGLVRPVINEDLHLITELADGRILKGQHQLTGKEVHPISARVERIWLGKNLEDAPPAFPCIRKKMKQLIGEAELICYPIGSFYTSLVANLLPKGVGKAIQANPCPKIYIPNTDAGDPEAYGLTITDQVLRLLTYLQKDDSVCIASADVLNYVLVDEANGRYNGEIDRKKLKTLGIEVINLPLATAESAPYVDPELLSQALLCLV